jgi:hypothetical protein
LLIITDSGMIGQQLVNFIITSKELTNHRLPRTSVWFCKQYNNYGKAGFGSFSHSSEGQVPEEERPARPRQRGR